MMNALGQWLYYGRAPPATQPVNQQHQRTSFSGRHGTLVHFKRLDRKGSQLLVGDLRL